MDLKLLMPLLEGFLDDNTKAKLKAGLDLMKLAEQVLPKEQQEELFAALKKAIPVYRIQKNVTFEGRKYAVAIFIEQHQPKTDGKTCV